MNREALTTIVVAGLGNIGSQLVHLLARAGGTVGRLILVDPDRFEAENLPTQAINPCYVGRDKARVLARRLRRIAPGLEVTPFVTRVEDVPRGCLQADLVLTALDSRAARQRVNELVWRLGIPWVDAGVEAQGGLARVTVYRPGPDSPCYECPMTADDYARLEQTHWCTGTPDHPTGAPAHLGALAASLQTALAFRMLGDAPPPSGQETVISPYHDTHYVTHHRRHTRCRFDHAIWRIRRLPHTAGRFTAGRALRLGGRDFGSAALGIEGHPFVMRMYCSDCDRELGTLHLARNLSMSCDRCGMTMQPVGFYNRDVVHATDLTDTMLRRPLSGLGVCTGDLLSLTVDDHTDHFVLGG